MSLDKRLATLRPEQKLGLLRAALASRRAAAEGAASTPGPLWLTPLAPRPAARLRLICFPHGGAGPDAFRPWPELLPPDIELMALCLPGRGGRAGEPAATGLAPVLEGLFAEIGRLGDRPFAFYGHSLGGAIAFAAAVALRTKGLPGPETVIVAAVAPPGGPTIDPGRPGSAGGNAMERLLGDPALREGLMERARADGRLMADLRALPGGAITAPLVAIEALGDEHLAPGAMGGWAACAAGSFALHRVPGPHLFHLEAPAVAVAQVTRALGLPPEPTQPKLDPQASAGSPALSLFFFSALEEEGPDRYRLFDEAVRFADRAGFRAVWIPERHFHPVGGLFPNPSVLAAATARSTSRIRIRSGSVVLPLHDPLRVAEEWSMVDNLSGGRVDLAVVPGWNPNDFVFAPDRHASRWESLFEMLEDVRRLWRGDAVRRRNGQGEDVAIRIHPRPMQPELPVWIATSANDASFERAGELGLNVLSALLIQSVEEFARRVALYRRARARAGHDPDAGTVTLMVHTCVGQSDAAVREIVRGPFMAYMRTVQSLWKETVESLRPDSATAQAALEDMVFERYVQRSTLFGSLETCLARARAFETAGATEIACMIDFGLSHQDTMAALGWLDRLREALSPAPAARP